MSKKTNDSRQYIQSTILTENILNNEKNNYLNITVKGGYDSTTSCGYRNFTFDQTFPQPVFDNLQEYYLAIIRAAIPLNASYLMLMPVDVDQDDPDVTPFKFTFDYNGFDYQSTVIYTPQNNYPKPSSARSSISEINPYYYVYNYNVFTEMLNNALITSYQSMFTANAVAISALGLTVNDYPYFLYYPSSQIFTLVYNKNFVNSNIELYMNDRLKILLGAFDVLVNYPINKSNGKDYQFRFIDSVNNNNEFDADNNENQQQYKFTIEWVAPIQRILFSTTAISLNKEIIQVSALTQNSFNFSELPIVFDLEPPMSNQEDATSNVIYASQLYRLIDIKSQGSMNQFNMKIQYLDKLGRVGDICIPPGLSGDVKIGFIHKSIIDA
jgi:hypothetical protein